MIFRVGQKVVCVDDADTNILGFQELVKGAVYTVRACRFFQPTFALFNKAAGSAGPSVWLEEVVRPIEPGFEVDGEIPFSVRRFRPVNTTDISIFRAMLVNPKQPVDA